MAINQRLHTRKRLREVLDGEKIKRKYSKNEHDIISVLERMLEQYHEISFFILHQQKLFAFP